MPAHSKFQIAPEVPPEFQDAEEDETELPTDRIFNIFCRGFNDAIQERFKKSKTFDEYIIIPASEVNQFVLEMTTYLKDTQEMELLGVIVDFEIPKDELGYETHHFYFKSE